MLLKARFSSDVKTVPLQSQVRLYQIKAQKCTEVLHFCSKYEKTNKQKRKKENHLQQVSLQVKALFYIVKIQYLLSIKYTIS